MNCHRCLQTSLSALLASCMYLAGQPADLSIAIENGQPRLSWPSQGASKVYTLQHRTDLSQPDWAPLFPWDQWPISDTAFLDTTGPEAARFYRLAVTERGRARSVTLQETASAASIGSIILFAEIVYGIDIPFAASHSVSVYRIDYETLDGWLGPTVASGALFIPAGMPAAASLLSYQHGTIHLRSEAPSNPGALERNIGLIAASHGYVVAMPDFLGLGVGSTLTHPYVHRRSSATAVVDLLRAVRSSVTGVAAIQQALPHGLSDKLFLLGYSQGAYVTLAAQKEIEEKHGAEFTITASAPSDGPYDLSGTMADIMTAPRSYPSPNYLPYVLLTYNTIYRLFDDPAEVLVQPYAATLPPLFDGMHTGSEIDAAMPQSGIPSEILQPAFLQAFTTDPDHPFRMVLRENDLLGWAPVSPTRLYHCAADDVVPHRNATVAYASFIAAGADTNRVQLVDPDPAATHGTCLFSGVPLILSWFESLR
ncbi:MAG TPA: lipase family protein [Candidatus Paceibacterota bacterium]|nr:hypothetical protein [Verrucomicrobiota bacterium]HOX02507.1 lipase family protein [Verrucomicrobiota bacterium]HRZ45430.1 lipase family protein [Candidatus Paceibacterota bacterium]